MANFGSDLNENRGGFRWSGPPADAVEREIVAAQINAVFRQMPVALAVNLVNATITAVVLQRLADIAAPFVWLSVTLLVTSGRFLLWLAYRGARTGAESGAPWALLATGGSLLGGLCWGLGGAVLFSALPALAQMFFALVVAGMCAGAVATSGSHLPTLLAFLLPASLPLAIAFLGQWTLTGGTLGVMGLVFVVAVSLAGRHLSRSFAETMRLRFELSEANFRLQAEVAERRAVEAALRQAQKLEAIGQLTGGIAHDFNNLLTIVIGNLSLAIRRTGDVSASTSLLQGALDAADRGTALIGRLLAFARKQRLEPQSVDLSCLVRGMSDLLHRTLGQRIRLVIDAAPGLPPARVDANQLELAILNLTINARDAMPVGGRLRIGLESRHTDDCSPAELSAGDYMVVSISDTGSGMDEATLARAFEPFFTTKQTGAGSGLGLPMVQGFAVQSEGAVRMRSTPSEGTTVELWLPRADAGPALPKDEADARD